ncbi:MULTISPECIES: hypothetical protein [Agromyces]|jgi:hypothetical protein|uniref:4-hydroxybenzoate polyprenyltransferase n=2 Tax=Agromyces mediolanus TaxID=41986 RepID=A0A918FDJ2_AGRME|nr:MULTISPECIES: hypothetical protein [Agromyces]MCD1570212.1 hypothetical protein [Agromyces mediolanus]GGR25283.1 hypothetical protein GCM10010196_19140 [Agromyces mediolanus]GLJ70826.1 hypothetical protein GCM10017583_00810 [Agromyces mediolanus]GLU90006.1 hypothetical protein Agsp01_22610 [Agromyces sp. NBRC 114283]
MSLMAVVFAETVHARELPVETYVYGLVALIVFFALGIVTYSYRDVANRHRAKAEAYAKRHGGSEHGGH